MCALHSPVNRLHAASFRSPSAAEVWEKSALKVGMFRGNFVCDVYFYPSFCRSRGFSRHRAWSAYRSRVTQSTDQHCKWRSGKKFVCPKWVLGSYALEVMWLSVIRLLHWHQAADTMLSNGKSQFAGGWACLPSPALHAIAQHLMPSNQRPAPLPLEPCRVFKLDPQAEADKQAAACARAAQHAAASQACSDIAAMRLCCKAWAQEPLLAVPAWLTPEQALAPPGIWATYAPCITSLNILVPRAALESDRVSACAYH